MDPSEIKTNLEIQLSEVETLQSMFCNAGEVRIEDPGILADMTDFVQSRTKILPGYLDVTINLLIENQKFELCVTLSHEYPSIEPDIYVRNRNLDKKRHASLNKNISDHIASLDRGEPCIFSAISWLQDNAENYIILEDECEVKEEKKNKALVRFWIYSHHIYSKSKRREIVDLANQLHVTGFCMPGKPGIVCVEGTESDCNEWWQTIKAMNWKRIFCKVIEEDKELSGDFLKFSDFSEVVFQNNNIKCNHMNMGELSKFLEEHRCGYIFKEIFGVQARTSS